MVPRIRLGSVVIPMALVGKFDTSVGQKGKFPFNLVFTTGHSDNIIHITINKKMGGATLASDGVTFAKDGASKKADYVGTAGTITTTGTGDCLGITIVGMPIDLQAEITLVLEPASAKLI